MSISRRGFFGWIAALAGTAAASRVAHAESNRPAAYHDSFDTWLMEPDRAAYRNTRTNEILSYYAMNERYARCQRRNGLLAALEAERRIIRG